MICLCVDDKMDSVSGLDTYTSQRLPTKRHSMAIALNANIPDPRQQRPTITVFVAMDIRYVREPEQERHVAESQKRTAPSITSKDFPTSEVEIRQSYDTKLVALGVATSFLHQRAFSHSPVCTPEWIEAMLYEREAQ